MDSIKILLNTIGISLELFLAFFHFYFIRILFDITIVGYYSLITSFLMAMSFILDLGFSIAHLKFIPEAIDEEQESEMNGAFFIFRIIQLALYIFFIIIIFPFIPIYDGNIFITILLIVSTILTFSEVFFNPLFLSKKFVIKKSLAMLISIAFRICFLIVFMNVFVKDMYFLTITLIISSVIFFCINLYLIRDFKFKKPSLKLLKSYLNYTLPLFIVSSLTIIINNIDILIVNLWFSLNEIANFFTAKQIFTFLTIFVIGVSNVLTTTFSKNISSGEKEKNIKIIRLTHKYINLIIVPIIFLIILYSSNIIGFLFGEVYNLSSNILNYFSFSLFTTSIGCAISVQFKALGKTRLIATITIIRNLIAIFLIVIFVAPFFLNMGSLGAAIAFTSTEFIMQLIFRPIYYIKYNIGFYWGSFRNLFIMLVVFLLQYYINSVIKIELYYVPLFILMDLALYFFINYLLKGFTIEDIKFFLSVINFKNIKNQIITEL